MKSVSFFSTVGISLQNNILKSLGENYLPDDLEDSCNVCFPDFINDLNQDNPKNKFIFPSAEIESLYYWLKDQQDIRIKEITLLHTKTEPSKKCSSVIETKIREMLEAKFVKYRNISAERELPINHEGFDFRVGESDKFSDDVAEFIMLLENKISEAKRIGSDRVVLNITAGYKILVSIFSLFGFLKDEIEVIYKHEDATTIIQIPLFPLTWDFKIFDEYRTLVKSDQKEIVFPPPTKFSALFRKAGDKWVKNAFGSMLSTLYDGGSLHRFGAGARLTSRLPENLKIDLNEHLEKWVHVWVGDQIPETVEHSRAHSTRLLEYAADLLEKKYIGDKQFLEAEELYLLMCCFWLHDIGHIGLTYSINRIKLPVALFPSLVRKWHSYITFDLLMQGDYLNDNEKEAVAWPCLYHRSKLPLLSEGKSHVDKIFKQLETIPLQAKLNRALPFKGREIKTERILLICALLRVCDALDIQSDRIVDESYWAVRKARTQNEVDYLMDSYERKAANLHKCDSSWNSVLENLKNEINNCREQWRRFPQLDDSNNSWELAQRVEQSIEQKIEPLLLKSVARAYGMDKSPDVDSYSEGIIDRSWQHILLVDLLSILDRVAFKMRQEAHFFKHSSVKLVFLNGNEKGNYYINIIFAQGVNPKQKENIAREIWSEMVHPHVKKILCDNGIYFIGIYSEGKKISPDDVSDA